jgi:murein DD-endopeptidase MepM/ murein hydrolase activator NlpD
MIVLTSPTLEKFVNSTWGRPREYRGGWHEGLDFPTKVGSPILAAADGEVVRVDNNNNSFAGRWIAIHHGGGIFTRYLHNTKNLVVKGQKVKRGQKIATAGRTGTSGEGKPHLHFDVKMLAPAHKAYEARYGQPTTGWGRTMAALGQGVPAETFMSGVTYSPQARKWASSRGVKFYSGLGEALLKTIAVGAAAYLGFKILE